MTAKQARGIQFEVADEEIERDALHQFMRAVWALGQRGPAFPINVVYEKLITVLEDIEAVFEPAQD